MRIFGLVFLSIACLALFAATPLEDLKLGLEAIQQGRMRDAERLCESAYNQFLHADPPDPRNLKAAALALSSAYQYTGRIGDAERVVVPVYEEWRRTKSSDLLPAIDSLASIRAQQGKWDEARRLASEGLESARAQLGPDHRKTRGAMAHLANLNLQSAHIEEADQLLEAALASAKKNGGETPEIVNILVEICKAKTIQHDYKGAILAGREALDLSTKADHHPMLLADSSYSLAMAYFQARQLERAEPLVKAAIARYEEAAGADSPAATGALILAADLEFSSHHPSAAAKVLKRAVEILRRSFGPDDVEVVVTEAKLAEVLLADLKSGEAAALLAHAVPLMQKLIPGAVPCLAGAYRDLAIIADQNGNSNDAELYLRRSIETFEAANFRGPAYVDVLQQYGEMLRRAHKKEARDVLDLAKTTARSLRATSR
jgi:hypothetical protein